MKNLSYKELADCQLYAEHVVNFYKHCNNGEALKNTSDAELAVREFNSDFRSFKAMFGYSIKGYISHIVDCIGFIVEC